MLSKTSTLTDDPVELKKLIIQLQDDHVAEIKKIRGRYESEVTLLHERIRHLYDKLFGRKSEKNKYPEESPQLPLFDMPEPEPEAELNDADEEDIEVKGHT